MDKKMTNSCNWEEIREFQSISEFVRFCDCLSGQIDAGLVEVVVADKPSDDLIFGLTERRYFCKSSGEIWRLISPDAPFGGLWEPVKRMGGCQD